MVHPLNGITPAPIAAASDKSRSEPLVSGRSTPVRSPGT
jgi:hypothetical protein